MRADRDRVLDMLAAIGKVRHLADEGRERFDQDELAQVYFTHQILVLGEAASRVSDDVRAQFPSVPWGKMIGMRNALLHGYFTIELDIVWDTAQQDLPVLERQLRSMLNGLEWGS